MMKERKGSNMNPFEIKGCVLLIRMSGLPAAFNLRELRDRIASCSADVLYHHFCETPLAPSFDYPDYRNDFAVWIKHKLDDDILAERLGIIDPYSFPSMEKLRVATLDIIDDRLSELTVIPWARPGHEFYFTEASTVVFDTGERVLHPKDLGAAIGAMTTGSIYYHFLEARRRPPRCVDDFSSWLSGFGKAWAPHVRALKQIDFSFYTLAELRTELLKVLKDVKGSNERAGKRAKP